MKRSIAVLVSAFFALAAGSAAAQQKVVLKFAHHAPVTFPYQDGALKFKEVAERLSNGRIEVQVFGAPSWAASATSLRASGSGPFRSRSARARSPTSRPPTTWSSCRS